MAKAHDEMVANADRLLQGVVAKYDDKISSIHRECEKIIAGKR